MPRKPMRRMPAVVALVILAGFHAALAWLLWDKADPNQAAAAMLEALKAAFLLAVGYFLGSSDGSARKTDLIQPTRGEP